MASVGPLIVATGANDSASGTQTWLNPGNITADDASWANTVVNTSPDNVSNYLKGTNPNPSALPSGAVILGIEVHVEIPALGSVTDQTVKLVKGGTISGDNKATGSVLTSGTKTYGGPTDLWGLSLTVADVKASTFGAVFQVAKGPSGSSNSIFVDYIALTIYYTDAVSATGALASVTVAGYAGAAAVEIDASGALATVDVAGKDATLGLGTTGALASVDVEGLAGAISSGAEGQGQAAAITVVGLAGTYGLGTLGTVASVTVGGFAGAATFVVSAAGALATVAVQSFAGLAIRAGGSGRYRPGAGRYVSARSPSGTFQSMKNGVGRFFGPRGGMGR